MFFTLATPESLYVEPTCSKVKAVLTSGLVEIYEGHQDLIGKIHNGLLSLKIVNLNNEDISKNYLLQDGVFVVSNQGLDNENDEVKTTSIYVYARRLLEISKELDLADLATRLQEKQLELDNEIEKLKEITDFSEDIEITSSKIIIIKSDLSFLEKAYFLALQNSKISD